MSWKVTACQLSRWMAADLYLEETEALRVELSLPVASEAIHADVGDAREPYRELLRQVRTRLFATRSWVEEALSTDGPVTI